MTTIEAVRGVHIGPEGVPPEDRTIGWHGLAWTARWLQHPDGPRAGEPWRFTPEQARLWLWWYAIDSSGRFVYRRGLIRRMKGWGKDPFAAALSANEMLGPCRFAGWGPDGKPIAHDHPAAWIQVAAVSKDQTRNTMTVFPGLFTKEAQAEFEMDIGKEIIYALHGTRRIEAVTSSPRAMEGNRPTFVLKNEALSLDTPLPTPTGWTTVGAVKPGDVIYGSTGPVRVVGATAIHEARDCYRVRFEDGTELVADDGHLWYVRVAGSGAKARVRSTVEMVRDGRRFMVPLVEPLESDEVELPFDPYVLGYWLGDGDSRSATVTVGEADKETLVTELAARGFRIRVSNDTHPGAPRICITSSGSRRNRNDQRPLGPRGQLAALGVLGNKHIPRAYLRGSRNQRLALLRGLMDSDGSVTPGQSQAIFVNQNLNLALGVVELARSLGYRVGISETLDERWATPRIGWRVTFRADESVNPFSLERKAHRVTGRRSGWKRITSIEPIESVPVRCIEVDGDDHLFVAGDGWTLTHNTQHWKKENEGHAMAEVIARNVAKGRDGASRSLALCNAFNPGEDSDAERDHEAQEKMATGRSRGTGFLYDSLEAPPDVELVPRPTGPDGRVTDEDLARARQSLADGLRAARGDSDWVDIERLIEEVYDPTTSPSTSRRWYLNHIIATEDAWVTPQEWDVLALPGEKVVAGEMVTLGLDGSKNDDNTALIGCRVSDGYLFRIEIWEPEKFDGEIPRAEVDAAVARAFGTYDVVGFFSDVHPFESYIDKWEEEYAERLCVRARERYPIGWDMRGSKAETTRAAESFHSAIVEGDVRHDGDKLFAQHVHNARRMPNNYGVTFRKESPFSSKKVDACAAAMLARECRQQYIALPDGKKRKVSGPSVYESRGVRRL